MNLEQIFKEFIFVVQENTKYTIGLIDNHGRIVSFSDKEKNCSLMDINQQGTNDNVHKTDVEGNDNVYFWANG